MNWIQVDFSIFYFIHHQLSNTVFDALMPFVRNKLTWIPLYIFLVYYLKQKQSNYHRIILMTAIAVVLGDIICGQLLKPLFGRVRPCHLYEGMTWLHNFNLCSSTYSFPSCHALNHTIIVCMLWRFLNNTLKKSLVLWVAIICFAQIYVGQHFLTDVTIGVGIGYMMSRGIKSVVGRYSFL